jgi:hypothetical protein
MAGQPLRNVSMFLEVYRDPTEGGKLQKGNYMRRTFFEQTFQPVQTSLSDLTLRIEFPETETKSVRMSSAFLLPHRLVISE